MGRGEEVEAVLLFAAFRKLTEVAGELVEAKFRLADRFEADCCVFSKNIKQKST